MKAYILCFACQLSYNLQRLHCCKLTVSVLIYSIVFNLVGQIMELPLYSSMVKLSHHHQCLSHQKYNTCRLLDKVVFIAKLFSLQVNCTMQCTHIANGLMMMHWTTCFSWYNIVYFMYQFLEFRACQLSITSPSVLMYFPFFILFIWKCRPLLI